MKTSYQWCQTQDTLILTIPVSQRLEAEDVVLNLSPNYLCLSWLSGRLALDLSGEVIPYTQREAEALGILQYFPSKIEIRLTKKSPGIWATLELIGFSKAVSMARREEGFKELDTQRQEQAARLKQLEHDQRRAHETAHYERQNIERDARHQEEDDFREETTFHMFTHSFDQSGKEVSDPETEIWQGSPRTAQIREPTVCQLKFTPTAAPGLPMRECRGEFLAPVKASLPALNPVECPLWHKDQGDRLLMAGHLSRAIYHFTESLQLSCLPTVFANRSLAYLMNRQYKESQKDAFTCLDVYAAMVNDRLEKGQGDYGIDEEYVRIRILARLGALSLWSASDFTGCRKKWEEALEIARKYPSFDDMAETLEADLEDLELKQQAIRENRLIVHALGDSAHEFDPGFFNTPCQEDIQLRSNLALAQMKQDNYSGALYCLTDLHEEVKEILMKNTINLAYSPSICLPNPPILVPAQDEERVRRQDAKAREKAARENRIKNLRPFEKDLMTKEDTDEEEEDWVTKRSNCPRADLPELPSEFEWVKKLDSQEWIGVRKKKTVQEWEDLNQECRRLQAALYSKNSDRIQLEIDRNTCTETQIHTAQMYLEELHRAISHRDSQLTAINQPGLMELPNSRAYRFLLSKILMRLLVCWRTVDPSSSKIPQFSRELLAIDPKNVEVQEVLEVYQKDLQATELPLMTLLDRGRSLSGSSSWQEALGIWQRAAIYPLSDEQFLQVHMNQSLCFQKLLRFEEVLQKSQEILEKMETVEAVDPKMRVTLYTRRLYAKERLYPHNLSALQKERQFVRDLVDAYVPAH